MYTVAVSKWDFSKGKSVDKKILTIDGKSVAEVRKKILNKALKKYSDPVGFDFNIYNPTEHTNDPVMTKFNGKWVTLGVEKGHGHIYANGIVWITPKHRYKLDKNGKIIGQSGW